MPVLFNRKTLPLAGLFVMLGACSSVVVPTEQIELTRNAVNRAVTADATQYAPVEMREAQDKLSAMDRALGEKQYEQARLLAREAEADARLAEIKARAHRTLDQLDSAEKGIEVLKHEMLGAPDAIPTHPAQ
ncbi:MULTISPECIES: DUF4398 domain-containing protein [unclassified Pseudomonas]|uniref:DUF4398 domain-containing protein n=1 Tax=unclassified Pseudomonas TaxID=196821 RepID=UPI002448036E|nr:MULTISPECIES: DUF4398 domain-containing protein [unclassified Pseudomonas]MDH0304299.1 DUF4398 domain-containing protein [Pseudomonas sp. GD04091]MDH1983298.1 DUF4398 domain-containing protein [Pseudomonas sp. GD03689]